MCGSSKSATLCCIWAAGGVRTNTKLIFEAILRKTYGTLEQDQIFASRQG
jgi:hypothetical protein